MRGRLHDRRAATGLEREAEALVQAARTCVTEIDLEAHVVEAGGARRLDQLRHQGPPDSPPADVRPDVDVRHVRCLSPSFAEHAVDEPDRVPVLLGDERNAVTNGPREVGPRFVPRLAKVQRMVELRVELLP